MVDTQQTAPWIGINATLAEEAYAAGDYDMLKAMLESIKDYASDLGYEPGALSVEDTEEDEAS